VPNGSGFYFAYEVHAGYTMGRAQEKGFLFIWKDW
jgi:hypothetical protein